MTGYDFDSLPRPGDVVEFMHGNTPQIAYVMETSSGKLRLLTGSRREVKLPQARLLPWTGPRYGEGAGRTEVEKRLEQHEAARNEAEKDIQAMELWDLAQGEVDKAPAVWFAELLWEEPGPDQVAAMGRALLSAKTHFKFHPPDFEIHPEQTVAARLEMAKEQRRRMLIIEHGATFFKKLAAGGQKPPEPEPEVADMLRGLLLTRINDPGDSDSEQIFNTLRKGLPDHPHLALILAQAWGLVDRHHNHLLAESGYDWGDEWSEAHADEIGRIRKFLDQDAAEPDPLAPVSVDSATTRDIDDAFSVAPTPEGGLVVSLALARPTRGWDFASPLGAAVADRATSLYLPEGSAHMLPEFLGTDLFSLRAGQPRPALVMELALDPEGALVNTTARTARVRVAENLTYDTAQEMAQDPDSPMALARSFAEKLKNRRLEKGAVIIRREDPNIDLEGEWPDVSVRVTAKPSCPDAEAIVSEFMILANRAAALYARERGVPLLHRTQDIALPPGIPGEYSEPSDIYQVVRHLSAPILEPDPRPHASIGAECYATITSPLRRYPDFVNMAQICAFLETGEPLFGREDLEKLLPRLNARLGAVSQVQRFRPRYWKLVHLAARGRDPVTALLVDDSGPLATLALPELQIYVRAPAGMLGDKLYPGKPYSLIFGRIDPLTNEIRIAEALAE